MIAGHLEGLVLKDRTSTYREGSRVGWVKVKDPRSTSENDPFHPSLGSTKS
jgi:ATP-dependent DNA ligase